MRVSVDKDDPGYREDATDRNYEAYLDGERVERCITADEEQGYIKKYKTDEDGKHVVSHDTKGDPIVETEELYGNVEIKVNSQ